MLELNKVPFSTYKRFPGLVKSVPLVVKCFPIRDPFAPLVDLGWPSQARATKIHAWCKWITHGKTFHYSGNWFHSGNTFTVEKRDNKQSFTIFFPVTIFSEFLILRKKIRQIEGRSVLQSYNVKNNFMIFDISLCFDKSHRKINVFAFLLSKDFLLISSLDPAHPQKEAKIKCAISHPL